MDKDDFSNVIEKSSLAAALIVPGGIPLYAAARYLKNLYNYKCVIECSKLNEKRKCYHQCNIKSIKNILKDLEFEYKIKRCDLSEHPKRCRKKLLTQIEYWQKRLIDAEYSYEKYLIKRQK